jgi:hypothetical protein
MEVRFRLVAPETAISEPAAQRYRQIKGHTYASQPLEGKMTIWLERIEDGIGWSGKGRGFVMIYNDGIHPQLLRQLYLLPITDAAIYADQKLRSVGRYFLHRVCIEPIPFFQSVGYVISRFHPERAKKIYQKATGGDTIDIIVSINRDALLVEHGLHEPVSPLVHILHKERIMKMLQQRGEESFTSTKICDPSLDE